MQNHEIFDHWWDYPVTAWWGLSAPTDEVLLQRSKTTQEAVAQDFRDRIAGLVTSNDAVKIRAFEDHLAKKLESEDDRRTLIETKAHSLLGQTGITVTLLVGSLSLSAVQATQWPLEVKITAWCFFLMAGFHFIVAGLHARNAVILVRGFARPTEDELLDLKIDKSDALVGTLYQAEHNSYINDVKAPYLKIAHWYFKAGLLTIFLAIFVLPPLLFFSNPKSEAKVIAGADTSKVECICLVDTTFVHWKCNRTTPQEHVHDTKPRDSVTHPPMAKTPLKANKPSIMKTQR